jgi:pimeloyl-[acyl-carrier protein] methyl ester esterase
MSKTFVFLTGWAMDEKIWSPFLSYFSQEITIKHFSWMNLESSQNINQIVEKLIKTFNQSESITLIGWSLGSISALKIASLYPEKIDQLILFSPTARFLKDPNSDLSFGWTKKSLEAMKKSLALNQESTLTAFYQKMFTKKERDMSFIDSFIETYTPTSLEQKDLQFGLDYLIETDVRDHIHNIKIPVHIIHGKQDKIISILAGKWLYKQLPNATFHEIDSGHLPFFTSSRQCADILTQALER